VSQATGSILHFITKMNKLNRKILHNTDFRFRITVNRRASGLFREHGLCLGRREVNHVAAAGPGTENGGTNRDEHARFGVDLLEFQLSFSVMDSGAAAAAGRGPGGVFL
jgi:hypothetical protein